MPLFGSKHDARVTAKYNLKEILGKLVVFALSIPIIQNMVLILRGAFSEVYKAINKKTGEKVAIKVVDKKSLKGKEDSLQNEIAVMQK